MGEALPLDNTAISFRQVEGFMAVASLRSITVAADRLHMSQSGLSRLIHELERQLGDTLFERHAPGLTLTQAGMVFLPFAQKLVATYADATRVKPCKPDAGLRIAASGVLLSLVVPQLMQRIPAALVGVPIHFHEVPSHQVVEVLREGKADVGLCMLESAQDELDSAVRPLLEAPLGLLAGVGTALPRSIQSLADLDALRFARLSEEMVLPRAIRAHAGALRPYFEASVVSTSVPGLIHAIAAGGWVTLASAVVASTSTAAGLQFVPLAEFLPPLNLCVVIRKNGVDPRWRDAIERSILTVDWRPSCSGLAGQSPAG